MKISTKTGDLGETSLLFNRRVKKNTLRVACYGSIDEFSAYLGLARCLADANTKELILKIQKTLVRIMTELACHSDDYEKLSSLKIHLLDEKDLDLIESKIKEIESSGKCFSKWTQSGENLLQTYLDIARTQCRRAERKIITLTENESVRELLIKYLNRLSDLLYLLETTT